MAGSLPNLIVIGAHKGGTTSLHHYLRQHPQIFMSSLKELDFFVDEFNWPKGIDWYRKQFSSVAPIRGESSPSYTHFPKLKGVPERIHHLIPDAKLICIRLLADDVEELRRFTGKKLAEWSL